MEHIGTHTIITKRLKLRRFRLKDFSAMFENWASDNDVTKYVPWNTHKNKLQTFKLLWGWVSNYGLDPAFYNWVITLDGTPIGSIGCIIQPKSNNMGTFDAENIAALGYCLGKKWWNKGYATEAASAIRDYMFEIGLDLLIAGHVIDNSASGRVMQKIGMTYYGEKSGYTFENGEEKVIKVYTLNREDYAKEKW